MLQHKEEVGKMDRRVTFQKKIFGTDASNQHKVTGWEDIDDNPTAWANIEENTGGESWQGEQLVSITQAKITVRHRTDLTTENRVVYNSKYYDIHAIIEVGRKRFTKIISESGGQYKETTT